MAQKTALFLVNLLQDVNILRGLAHLVQQDTGAPIRFLVSAAFRKRDSRGIWGAELEQLAQDLSASLLDFTDSADMQMLLQGQEGVLIAASESNLNAHRETRDAFRLAPPGLVKITLQHGLECIGFLQSREHVIAHGRDISFNADIVCGWFEPERLTSMIPSERAKLQVTGPSTLLPGPQGHMVTHPPINGGIICENMHSVRLHTTGNHRGSFMETFFEFCDHLQDNQRGVTLRPHPGGQYVLNNNVDLPENVQLNNLPMYHVNLPGYSYGISAPSTVVLDMVLAGIPTAVWRDPAGIMDASTYDGLTEISTLEDWIAFERDCHLRPEMILERQRQFLTQLGVPTDPTEVRARYSRLMRSQLGSNTRPKSRRREIPADGFMPRRILFVANDMIPTLQLSFLKPLDPLFGPDQARYELISERDIKTHVKATKAKPPEVEAWLEQKIRDFNPDMILCCRYSGPYARTFTRMAHQELKIPLIYHVDDDLLNIPRELGEQKFKFHNDPRRLDTVRHLQGKATLIYASTAHLKGRLKSQGIKRPILNGPIYCASRVLRPAQPGPVRRIGYMGFDHAHDFEIALPALEQYLEANPEVEFELFGSIPMPPRLKRFGDRVVEVPPVRDYAKFLQALADRHWDIGICPLASTPFNRVKANTKWVEYTACGMATIASRKLIYDECIGSDRGLLVDRKGWYDALQALTDDPVLRYRTALLAQSHLQRNFSRRALRHQILSVFKVAEERVHPTEDGFSIPAALTAAPSESLPA